MKVNLLPGPVLIVFGIWFALSSGCNYTVEKVGRSAPGAKPNLPIEGGTGQDPAPDTSAPKFSEIYPILVAQCLGCHSDSRRVAALSVESWEAMLENPRAIVPGDSANSGIYASVTDDYMPDAGWVARGLVRPLTGEEKEALRRWIDAGALKN